MRKVWACAHLCILRFDRGAAHRGHRAPATAGTAHSAGTAHAHERHKRTFPGTPLRPRNSSSADPGTGHLVAQVSPRRACLRMRPPVAAFLGAQPRRPALRGRPARRWGLGAGRSVPPFHSVPVRGRRPTAQAARSLREHRQRAPISNVTTEGTSQASSSECAT